MKNPTKIPAELTEKVREKPQPALRTETPCRGKAPAKTDKGVNKK